MLQELSDTRNGRLSSNSELAECVQISATKGRNTYRWTREVYGKDYICSLDRKPDPRVEVCL